MPWNYFISKVPCFISGYCTLVFIHEVGNCRAWQSSCSFIINRYPFQFFLNSSFVKFSNLYSEKICNCIQVVFQALGLPLQANVNPVQIAQMHANVKALVMFLVSRIKYFDCRWAGRNIVCMQEPQQFLLPQCSVLWGPGRHVLQMLVWWREMVQRWVGFVDFNIVGFLSIYLITLLLDYLLWKCRRQNFETYVMRVEKYLLNFFSFTAKNATWRHTETSTWRHQYWKTNNAVVGNAVKRFRKNKSLYCGLFSCLSQHCFWGIFYRFREKVNKLWILFAESSLNFEET